MNIDEYIEAWMNKTGKTREEVEELAIIKEAKKNQEKEDSITFKKPIDWA